MFSQLLLLEKEKIWTCTHKTVELGDGSLGLGLADVPHLDAALAARVHVLGGVADGHSAHHLSVREGADLPSRTGNPRAHERIGRERYGLRLAVPVHVE